MATIYHGTDVSRYQGNINWATYASAKDFVIIKAAGADDGLYTDSNFYTYQAGARAQAGLRIGYYFFGDRRVDAASAANYFISVVGTLNNGEILVLDIETSNFPPDNWAYIFCTALTNFYGFKPFVYMSQLSPTSTSLSWPLTNPIAYFWLAGPSLVTSDFSQTTGNVDSTWGGLAAPNYRILQNPILSVSGIQNPADTDTFYSPNNTLNDWNALGYSGSVPPPSPGTLTVATVTGPTVSYTQPSKQTINLPTESYDQVLFSTVFHPPAITSSSWPVNIPGPPTGLNQYAFPIGNYTFSINGVSNLNDFGFINAADYGQFPGTLPTVVVQPIVDSGGGLTFDVTVNIPGAVSTSVDLILNIALIAYPDTTNVPISSVTQGVSRSSVFAGGAPTDYSTYRRIDSDYSTGTGSSTIEHGLGAIPNLLYWVQDNSGTIEMQPVSWASNGHTTSFGLSMDVTTIYFNVDATNNAHAWIRTYKDN